MRIRAAGEDDRARLAEMRHALWPEGTIEEHDSEVPETLANPDYLVLVAERDGRLIGFAEVGTRNYAEGAYGPTAYLEGIWVEETRRRDGVGRALLAAGEQWARERGFARFGSDALIDNHVSHAWHEAAGFAEVERFVAFVKRVG